MADNNKTEVRGPTPPYVPFKTFIGFVSRLKETVIPERIDTSVLRTYSGSIGRMLTATLKYLGLIEEGGKTTEKLARLVEAYNTDRWKDELADFVFGAYRDILVGLDLDKATRGQLEEKFRARGVDGDTLTKCVSFFLAAIHNAGVTLSPHITAERRGRPPQPRGKAKKTRVEPRSDDSDYPEGEPQPGRIKVNLPLPSNPSTTVTVVVSEDVTVEDWAMVDATMRTFIEKRRIVKE